MSGNKETTTRQVLSAEEFSSLFRSDPEHERLYRASNVRLEFAERTAEMRRAAPILGRESEAHG